MADLEARQKEPGKPELLDKRLRAYVYRRNVRIPRDSNDGRLPVARPIDFYGIRLDFITAEREIEQGDDVKTQWFCKAIRITNKGSMRRLVTALETVTTGPRVSGMLLFRKLISRRTVQVVELPENLLEFELGVKSAPGSGYFIFKLHYFHISVAARAQGSDLHGGILYGSTYVVNCKPGQGNRDLPAKFEPEKALV
ncbi:hypothetical protein E4U59_003292 [Claviceps monticola]|nr:hypothetical protein E4U59_003292 [Claviceps monticola]